MIGDSMIYASHLPVLLHIGRTQSIRRAVEFGAGYHSTPTFLDRTAYPVLEKLLSVEVDLEWWTRLESLRDDRRLKMTTEYPEAHFLHSADMIFIDDGQSAGDRIETIRGVIDADPLGLVVIHDFEVADYQQAADFEHCAVYRTAQPYTAVCWNGTRDIELWEDRCINS